MGATEERYNSSAVPEKALKLVMPDTRKVFFWIFILICAWTLVGNLASIYTITRRKAKVLQKTCIITLAISDVLSAIVFTVNCLETFSKDLMTWVLGEFLCHAIPMAQLLTTTTSSIVLLIISLDRYQNIIYAMSKRWNPNIYYCSGAALLITLMCGVISYPMYLYFDYYAIEIIYEDQTRQASGMCVSLYKAEMTYYYATITTLIFAPLIILFIWFYFNIARLIWQHRKPVGSPSDLSNLSQDPIKSSKDVRVERKMRTFKIILVLMFVFIFCRLPYWVYSNIKLSYRSESSYLTWNLHYTLMALNVLNCALNPFLYTYLNGTIVAFEVLRDFFVRVFCCWCTNVEFEDFENNQPFGIEDYDKEKRSRSSSKGKF